ncbi:MAG: CTP synthetase [Halodesulfurarchaeum sp.]
MKAVIAGPDRGIGDALADNGVEVVRVDGLATGDSLDAADIAGADLLVLTDIEEATAVPVAKDRNPALRIVFFTPDSLPEFVRGQLDLSVDPALLGPDAVAEELVGSLQDATR